jgi:hypothetical protein
MAQPSAKESRAMMKAVFAAALGLTLASCAGVHGPVGNDTGGIIPWSPAAERASLEIADRNCAPYRKYAVITSVHRVYGDYIGYICKFERPRRHRLYR